MENLDEENFDKEAYRPRLGPRKRKPLDIKTRLKNRLRYRKNKFRLRIYNRKYRQRNKMLLKRRRQIRNKRKRK